MTGIGRSKLFIKGAQYLMPKVKQVTKDSKSFLKAFNQALDAPNAVLVNATQQSNPLLQAVAKNLTLNNVLLGNGTSALQAVAPGASGNVLTSDGTTWTLLPTVVGDVSSVLTPGGSATSSSGANPEYAFDLSASTSWSSGTGLYDSGTGLYSGSDSAGGEWIQIDLSSAVAVKHYSIASPNGLQWSFAGSPDGSNWTTLDTQTMNFTSTTTNTLFLSASLPLSLCPTVLLSLPPSLPLSVK